jgi:purine catabolism regulator
VLAEAATFADRSQRVKILEELRGEFLHNPIIKELNGVHVYLDEGLFSIYPIEEMQGEEKLNKVLLSCVNGLFDPNKDQVLRLAMSNRKAKPESLLEAFSECSETLQLAERLDIKERVVQFDTIEWAYIFQHVPRERMERFCDKVLGGLVSKDSEDSHVMLRTLEAFLDNDGQVNETAKRLFIHRNTATYRIEKISELLDMDFKKVNDLLRLKLVFLFRIVLNSERP